jgi:hypothetical protein
MLNRLRITGWLSCLLLIATAGMVQAITTSPAAASTTSESEFVTNFTFNSCNNNEAVILPGTLHIVTQNQPDGSVIVRINGTFRGTGSLGNEYVVVYRRTDTFLTDSFKLVEPVLAVSQGSAPNQLVTTTFSYPPFTFTSEAVCHG